MSLPQPCPTTSPPAEPLDLAAAAALEGVRGANPLVGAVITGPEGYVLAVGRHRGRGTAHAEVEAIRALHNRMLGHYKAGELPEYFALNQQIHEAILAAAGNGALSAAARTLLGRLRRVRFTANIDEQGDRWREAVRDPRELLALLGLSANAALVALQRRLCRWADVTN